MKRLWMITNPASGSATEAKCNAILAIFEERGLTLVGRTSFPDEPMPEHEALTANTVDTLVLFAGDGTINAAACRYDSWGGEVLILPGGTMNILAKELHGEATPEAIVHAAAESQTSRPIPFVEAGPHRAFVSMIMGPAATWGAAREALRYRRFAKMRRALRRAWAHTNRRGVYLFDGTRRAKKYKALLISPEDGWLKVSAFSTSTFWEAAELGWEWLMGRWGNATSVDIVRTAHVTVSSSRRRAKPLHALFDGEEVKLQSPARVGTGMSRLKFLTTVGSPKEEKKAA